MNSRRRYLRKLSSVRARLTIWNTITFALVLVALGVVFRFLAQSYLLSALDREITAQAKRMQDIHTVKKLIVSDNSAERAVNMKFVTTGSDTTSYKVEKPVVSQSVH